MLLWRTLAAGAAAGAATETGIAAISVWRSAGRKGNATVTSLWRYFINSINAEHSSIKKHPEIGSKKLAQRRDWQAARPVVLNYRQMRRAPDRNHTRRAANKGSPMRRIGTQASGIRLPIISRGDDLAAIVADSLFEALQTGGLTLKETDVVGVTEAIVAKSQGNFAGIDHIAADIRQKFPDGEVGVVFPILSRNRFFNVLKGISRGAKKVHLLLQFPCDEVGNPLMNPENVDAVMDTGQSLFSAAAFRKAAGEHLHPFTGVDYISLYKSAGDNIEVHVSNDPRTILGLTHNILVGEIHTRMTTKSRLLKAGARNVYTLCDILSHPVDGSGYNPQYGILGSNLSGDEELKLFPRDCDSVVNTLRAAIAARCGVAPEVLIYGDGAFKDPQAGIWELADPVVSPAYTKGLEGRPREIKIKLVADSLSKDMDGETKTAAITEIVRAKNTGAPCSSEGTTPRNYVDLLGSLCDLISGSGDKGTPVVLIQGYFDDFSSE